MKRAALCGAVAGLASWLLAGIGYGLGWNDAAGLRAHTNVVPFLILAGAGLLLLSGALLLSRLPHALPGPPVAWGILTLSLLSWFFVALYVEQVSELISVRADILSWSESPFVDHIIRLRAGQPQFTPPEDANAYAYTPGAPLLTYAIAGALFRPISIPAYRIVQQFYLLLAVLFAALTARELLRLCRPESRHSNFWLLLWFPFLYLIATNPDTNPFTHTLHNDALVLTVNGVAFWLLTKHLISGDDRWLVPMAVLPAVGYLVKQKEVIWAGLYILHMLLEGRVALRRIVLFGVVALVLWGLSVSLCYALWGDPYLFWTFKTLGSIHVSLTKVLEQVTGAAWYVTLGLLGGAILLRGETFRRLFPVYVCWLILLITTAYTSGVAFRPAHLGSASMMAAVFFLVALAKVWPEPASDSKSPSPAEQWLRAGVLTACVLLFYTSAGFFRIGSAVPQQLNRFIADIEKEFTGAPADQVLLDFGSWVYLPQNVVMKDRESPIGTLRGTRTSDFAMTIERIRNRQYPKILARKRLDGSDPYLYADPRINQALVENYREVRVIRSPGVPSWWLYRPLLADVAVLEPAGKEPLPARNPASPSSGKSPAAREAPITSRPD